ncbi:MAG: rod shape-determining protein MreC [Deltaproteobacteria bacterium]|nr:rod shape-determining protein MreC [Deltaproteobacteria bacterium]
MLDILKNNRVLITGVVLAILMAGLLSLRLQKPEIGDVAQQGLDDVISPFQSTYHKGVKTINEWVDDYVILVDLKQENRQLKMQIETLQEELNHHINSSIQFNLLREQLKFMEEDPHQKVFSEVIGESVDNFHHVLVINKGRSAGIRRNFPVVLREGVVGRIQSVTADRAVVQLIVDRRHQFPVLIQRTREQMMIKGLENHLILEPNENRGMLVGLGEGLQVKRIRMLTDVQKGDRVITSGMAGIFPKGQLVGIITDVRQEKHELFQTAEVRSAVDFDKIEGVFVILKSPKSNNFPIFSSP